MSSYITQDKWLGVLGGGQLGRMFAQAAAAMGYRVEVFDPDPLCPAAQVAAQHTAASWDDHEALCAFAQRMSAVTLEFENIPAEALEVVAAHTLLAPDSFAVGIARDRVHEKRFFTEIGLHTAPWQQVNSCDQAREAFSQLNVEYAILKTAELGYDGKGQVVVDSPEAAAQAYRQLSVRCVLEARVALEREISVILARGQNGAMAVYDPAINLHQQGILHTTEAPAQLPTTLLDRAQGMARLVAESLNYVGVVALELFLTTDGQLLVNEMAPRPHNSGHHTIDACHSSQFEQQVRALTGLPLGCPKLHSHVIMRNLLGDLWTPSAPNWAHVLQIPQTRLHLYGKTQARAGRKMGHLTLLHDKSPEHLSNYIEEIERALERL